MTQKNRRIVMWSILAIVVVVIIAAIVPFTGLMPVKNIQVNGAAHAGTDEVRAATGISEGTPMGRVDTDNAARQVAGLDWVNSVTVSRHWPSSVDVDVTEHHAVAFVIEDGQPHLLDQDGENFTVDEPPEEAVEITGDAARDETVSAGAVAVVTSISDAVRKDVDSVEARGPHTYVLHVKDGKTVYWGANEDNQNKALALETVLQRDGEEFNISNPQLITVK